MAALPSTLTGSGRREGRVRAWWVVAGLPGTALAVPLEAVARADEP
jgi:hypothetical protein